MKVKETAKKPYGICPASMTIWNADQTYNKKGILGSYALRNNMFDVGAMLLIAAYTVALSISSFFNTD